MSSYIWFRRWFATHFKRHKASGAGFKGSMCVLMKSTFTFNRPDRWRQSLFDWLWERERFTWSDSLTLKGSWIKNRYPWIKMMAYQPKGKGRKSLFHLISPPKRRPLGIISIESFLSETEFSLFFQKNCHTKTHFRRWSYCFQSGLRSKSFCYLFVLRFRSGLISWWQAMSGRRRSSADICQTSVIGQSNHFTQMVTR